MCFVDSDREIEEKTGVSIPTIFEIEGQDGFRRRESQVIAECAEISDCVMATGGGAVLREENRAVLRANGWVVYLDVSPDVLAERTRIDRNRPLLQVANPLQKLQELFEQRDPLYREVAHIVIDGSNLSPHTVMQRIIRETRNR